MTTLQINIDTSEAQAYFRSMERKMLNYRPVFEVGRAVIAAANAENFTSAGLRVGGWAPLRPATVAWKAENGFPPSPLIRTGRLMESLTTLRGAPNEIRSHSATFGTDVAYAKYHQYGTRHMARRPIAFAPEEAAGVLGRAALGHIVPDTGISLASLTRSFSG
jgi:phage gpG-like protein